MMIEEIINGIHFDLFYSQCHPAYCTYSYTHRFDVLFVITTVIGIFGAVSFLLRFIAPYVAKMIFKKKNRVQINETTARFEPVSCNQCKYAVVSRGDSHLMFSYPGLKSRSAHFKLRPRSNRQFESF